MKDKVIKDSKKLAYSKWKVFLESIFTIGVLMIVGKIIIMLLNHFGVTDISLEGLPKGTSFLPLILMLVGGIGADQLKNKYID